MPVATLSPASFDAGISAARDPLAAAAASLAAEAEAQRDPGTLVIAVRPTARDYRVVSSDSGNGALRAAVSVMVASENRRLWADAKHQQVTVHSVTSLPEVVRAAAEGAGVTTVLSAPIRVGDQYAAVAMWFGQTDGVADAGARQHVLDVLDAAAHRYLALAAEQASNAAPAEVAEEVPGRPQLSVGSDDPEVDGLTGLASKQRFDRAIDEFDGDEATLLLIDLDHFATINDEFGTEVGDRVLQEVAVRLAGACRKCDLVARLDADEFAVVLTGVHRHTGLEISKRLLATIAEPLPSDLGPTSVTATVAFAHEFGLVDMEELLESADTAVASGKRSGRARIVIAS